MPPTLPPRPAISYAARAQPLRPTHNPERITNRLNEKIYAEEFDALPIPDQALATEATRVYSTQNLAYIPSKLPAPAQPDYRGFLESMAKRQWRPATLPQGTVRPAARLMGQHRPATPALASRPLYGKHATNWDQIRTIETVNAYAYRGDKLPIQVIQRNGGFQPSSHRQDPRFIDMTVERFTGYMQRRFGRAVDPAEVRQYIAGKGKAGRDFVEYEIWRALMEGEEMHLGGMVADEFLKGYVSTSRVPSIAWGFANGNQSGGGNAKSMYYSVFAVHVPQGFLMPACGAHAYSIKHEAEIANPGPLPWDQVVGFRTFVRVDINNPETFGKPSNFIFLRKGFAEKDPDGAQALFMGLGSLIP